MRTVGHCQPQSGYIRYRLSVSNLEAKYSSAGEVSDAVSTFILIDHGSRGPNSGPGILMVVGGPTRHCMYPATNSIYSCERLLV